MEVLHLSLPSSSLFLSLSSPFSLALSSARTQGMQFDPQPSPATAAPDTLHSSPFPLAFENKHRGPALFVVKNEQLRLGMFPRRKVKRSVWTSGHLQCLTCRHVLWKGGWLPTLRASDGILYRCRKAPLRSWDCLSGHLLWNPLWKTPGNWSLTWNP